VLVIRPSLSQKHLQEQACRLEANAPVEAWSSTNNNAGVLIKANVLREQAREVLISAARAL
jgi:hypothetical protein